MEGLLTTLIVVLEVDKLYEAALFPPSCNVMSKLVAVMVELEQKDIYLYELLKSKLNYSLLIYCLIQNKLGRMVVLSNSKYMITSE